MKIIIFGANGMLGHMLFAELLRKGHDVYGACRSPFPVRDDWRERIIPNIDARNLTGIFRTLDETGPEAAINAVGLIRQKPEGRQKEACQEINALFPHKLYEECQKRGIRLIHYSTDCVFDGQAGHPYLESDPPTARDFYGKSKYEGEVNEPGALTLRTSIIGPELRDKCSLLEWFLNSQDKVKGYVSAIYTGLPTSEQARILDEYVLERSDLEGLYHLAGKPVSKHDLLNLIAREYDKKIEIVPNSEVREDKRLDAGKFLVATGYQPPNWPTLIANMRESHLKNLRDFQQ